MHRHPQLSQQNAESISQARGALMEGCRRGWFKDAEQFCKDKNIEYTLQDAARQYNGDETGFQLYPKAGRVVAPKGDNVYSAAGGSKDQVTVLITTIADGQVVLPTIVYPYKQAIPFYILNRIPEGYCATRSDSGWMTSQVFFKYMANIFIPYLAAIIRQKKGFREED